jgi:signal transduction histidine kinase
MKQKTNSSHYRLVRQIFLCLLGVAFTSVFLFGFFWADRILYDYHKEVKLLKKSLIETKKLEIKSKILQIKDYIQWVQSSPLKPITQTFASIESAEFFEYFLKIIMLDSISKLRYAENEYVFVNSLSGKALITNGKINISPVDILASGDTSWINIFKVQQLAASEPGGVYHTYTWQKLSTSDSSVKTSYFSYIPQWKWIIGTGFYEDDINSVIKEKRRELYAELRKNLIIFIIYLLITSLLCYLLVRYLSKSISKNIDLFKSFFKKAESENQFIDISQVSYKEFAYMAEAANQMVEGRNLVEEEIRHLNVNLEKIVAERTAQLAYSNRELESFSYSISHDLRAPLRAINGFSQILAGRHRFSLNEEGKQYIDYIVAASIRMEQLINDLLNYSRLGRKQVNFHPVSLNTIFDSIYLDFEHQLKDINAKFIKNRELPQIIGDETLLLQIFTNLVSNAITYRRKDVSLIINICYMKVENDHIIKISDNGIGIHQEYLEKIFNVFQRLHSEEEYPGTGIGLASVKKAVIMLGGTVWVDSVVGEGSTFYIKFPDHIIT